MSDLDTLFSTDPLKLSDQDIDKLIASYRAARNNFNLGVKPVKAAKEKTKVKDIDLDELLS